jgi:hypothetical protein
MQGKPKSHGAMETARLFRRAQGMLNLPLWQVDEVTNPPIDGRKACLIDEMEPRTPSILVSKRPFLSITSKPKKLGNQQLIPLILAEKIGQGV